MNADDPTQMDIFTAGQQLSQARTRAGLSLADVSARIKFSPRQIEALENDDLEQLGFVLSRGLLRSYARLLALDEHALIATLPIKNGLPANKISIHDEQIVLTKNPLPWRTTFAIIGALVLLLAPWLSYRWLSSGSVTAKSNNNPMANVSTAPVSKPLPTPVTQQLAPPTNTEQTTTAPTSDVATNTTITPPLASSAAVTSALPTQPQTPDTTNTTTMAQLQLSFSGDSWVSIHDGQKHTVTSQLYHAGQKVNFTASTPIWMVIGNAAQVTLTYNNQPFNLAPYTQNKLARLNLGGAQ